MKNNEEIRKALKNANMTQWQLATILGVSENTVYRMLRSELPKEEKERFLKAIKGGV